MFILRVVSQAAEFGEDIRQVGNLRRIERREHVAFYQMLDGEF